MAKVNILISWFESVSNAPKPSVSINNNGSLLPFPLSPYIGFDQIHRPFVHGLTVGPTLKPF